MAVWQALSSPLTTILRLKLRNLGRRSRAMSQNPCLGKSRVWSSMEPEHLLLAAPLLMPELSGGRSLLMLMAQESLLAAVLTAAKTRPRLIEAPLTWLAILPNPSWKTGLGTPGNVSFPWLLELARD